MPSRSIHICWFTRYSYQYETGIDSDKMDNLWLIRFACTVYTGTVHIVQSGLRHDMVSLSVAYSIIGIRLLRNLQSICWEIWKLQCIYCSRNGTEKCKQKIHWHRHINPYHTIHILIVCHWILWLFDMLLIVLIYDRIRSIDKRKYKAAVFKQKKTSTSSTLRMASATFDTGCSYLLHAAYAFVHFNIVRESCTFVDFQLMADKMAHTCVPMKTSSLYISLHPLPTNLVHNVNKYL